MHTETNVILNRKKVTLIKGEYFGFWAIFHGVGSQEEIETMMRQMGWGRIAYKFEGDGIEVPISAKIYYKLLSQGKVDKLCKELGVTKI